MPDPQTTAGYPKAAYGSPAEPHAPPSWPDVAALEQLANALFQSPPHQPSSSPASPGIPAAPPSPVIMPAPSVVTTAAPFAPANPPMGAPDVPPTTIPSYVPTPNIAAPSSPPVSYPSAAPFGFSDVPQPGASPGSFGPTASPPADPGTFPGLLDFSTLQARPSSNAFPQSGGSSTVPGGAAPASSDAPYFLSEANLFARPAQNDFTAPLDFKVLSHDLRPDKVPALGAAARPFDPHAVRRDFPLLQEHVHGKPLIWLDNAATTQKPQAVIDRLAYFYEHENSNVHRGAHALAARATDAYEAARDKVRRFLGAPSPKEIIFVRGITEGINLVAQAWGRHHLARASRQYRAVAAALRGDRGALACRTGR
jgi:cysteine desulfurase/selenocysteine lyase